MNCGRNRQCGSYRPSVRGVQHSHRGSAPVRLRSARGKRCCLGTQWQLPAPQSPCCSDGGGKRKKTIAIHIRIMHTNSIHQLVFTYEAHDIDDIFIIRKYMGCQTHTNSVGMEPRRGQGFKSAKQRSWSCHEKDIQEQSPGPFACSNFWNEHDIELAMLVSTFCYFCISPFRFWLFRYFGISLFHYVFRYFYFFYVLSFYISICLYFDVSIFRYFDVSIFRYFDISIFRYFDISIRNVYFDIRYRVIFLTCNSSSRIRRCPRGGRTRSSARPRLDPD